MQLFWRKGYESSSLQQLIDTMGLSKSSFYQAFKSKPALFQRCVVHYRQSLISELKQQLKEVGCGKTFICNLFHRVANETHGPDARRGCLLMNTASEFSQSDPQVAELVKYSIGSFIDVIELALQQAQQQGKLSQDKDTRTLATYLVSSMSGLKNIVKAGADSETVTKTADIILSVLD